MKKVNSSLLVTSLATLLCFFSVAYISCSKSNTTLSATSCQNVYCQNNGICVNGVCGCLPGYQDSRCGTLWNAKFVGTWTMQETLISKNTGHTTPDSTYTVHLVPAATPTSFFIDSLLGNPRFSEIVCVIDSTSNGFNMEQFQQINGNTLTIVGGNGTIDSAHITISGTYARVNLQSPSYGNDTFKYTMTKH